VPVVKINLAKTGPDVPEMRSAELLRGAEPQTGFYFVQFEEPHAFCRDWASQRTTGRSSSRYVEDLFALLQKHWKLQS
jgi:hypothetical protein